MLAIKNMQFVLCTLYITVASQQDKENSDKRKKRLSQLTTFASVEIHVVMDHENVSSSHNRIFLHQGTPEKKDKVNTIFLYSRVLTVLIS